MLKKSSTILTLIMLTILSYTVYSKTSDNKIPNVHIAFAHLNKSKSINGMVLTEYKLDSIYKGKFLKDDYVYIPIKKETIPKGGIPEKAILILHLQSEMEWYEDAIKYIPKDDDDLLRTYVPLQNDARKGILPDTVENRKKIESLSIENISHTPVKDQIAMEKAIEIAKKKNEEGDDEEYHYTAHRYPYGWVVDSEYASNVFGSGSRFWVGDDGEIKYILWGM